MLVDSCYIHLYTDTNPTVMVITPINFHTHHTVLIHRSEESPQRNFLLIIFGIPQLYFNSFYDLLYSKGHRYFLITIIRLLYVQE